MKNIVLLHIPHSRLKLTKEFKNTKKFIDENEIKNFNMTITDLFTNELFSFHKFNHIKAKYSRICCDMEKFADDKIESMSKYGMGVVYTKTNQNKSFINCDDIYKELVLKKYYYPYHDKLNKSTQKYLEKNKPVILVDCHSFSEEIIMNGNTHDLPEICIGSNENSKNDLELLKFTNEYFQKLGYKTAINYPYSGSMIPNNLIDTPNDKFTSIMVEINRSTYLKEFKKTKNFVKLKKDIYSYLIYLKNYQFN